MPVSIGSRVHLSRIGAGCGAVLVSLFVGVGMAQPVLAPVGGNRLTVQECVDIALKNNLSIRQGQLTVDNNTLQLRQARLNQLPAATFQGTQSFSSGRNIDPFTNAFVQQSISSNNVQLNSSVTIFNGFALRNTIRQNDLTLQASQEELLATRNTVTINVLQAYLNALTGTEQLTIAQRQADVTRAQLARTERLVQAGTLPEANLFDLRATLASNELDIVTAQNTLDLAKVSLLQQMNQPVSSAGAGPLLEVVPVEIPDPGLSPYAATPEQLYETSVVSMPDVRGAELRVRSAGLGVEVARAGLYPILTVSGNLFSQYSSSARARVTATGQTSQQLTPYFVTDPTGAQTPIYTAVPVTTTSSFGYFDQLSNNLNRSLSLSLRVPIFQGYLSRNRVTTARIQQQNAELNGQNIRLQLRQQIETAYTNMRAAANRYRATLAQVTALERAFQAAESRLNAGASNGTDYAIAKNNLDRARAGLIQAKYDYVFRLKLLDYYQNKPLTF
jgi:outer membrane protein